MAGAIQDVDFNCSEPVFSLLQTCADVDNTGVLVGKILRINTINPLSYNWIAQTGVAAYTEVNKFSDLPDQALHIAEIYIVQNSTYISFPPHLSGIYRSDGINWIRLAGYDALFQDNLAIWYDVVDTTKHFQLELSTISPNQTRVMTVPDANFTPEQIANKLAAFQVTPDDTHYPSEKLVYDQLALKAPIDNPVFTTKIETPAFKMTTAPSPGFVLGCDAQGNGVWQAGGGGTAPTVDNIGTLIGVTASTKNPPIDADIVGYSDTQDSNKLKSLSWTNIKAFLKTYFDGVYALIGHNHTGVYEPADATILKSAAIGVSVEAYDSTILKDADIGVSVEAYDSTILKDADIGVSVEAYDSTILKSAAIGVSVQAYNANTVIDASYVHTDNNYTNTAAGNSHAPYSDAETAITIAVINHGVATKGTFADNDEIPIIDSADNSLKKNLWSLVKSTLKTYFDGIYAFPNTSLQLDQTSAQTISNGQPIQATLDASEIVATTAAKKLQTLTVATYPSLTELSYVKGLSSAVQTQINGKQATLVSNSNIKTGNKYCVERYL
jgi:hypothetical protein